MTNTWKRVAIGVAVVAGLASITLVARPGILLAAGMMGGNKSTMMQSGMMQSGMMNGDMSKMHDAMSGMHTQELNAVASALGMTADDLTKALTDGRGVADLAKEKGVELKTVTDAIAAARKATFDQLVKDGILTQAQADQMVSHMDSLGFMTLTGASMMQNGGTCFAPQTQTPSN